MWQNRVMLAGTVHVGKMRIRFHATTGKSMSNLLSYCGLVDARIRDSDKYLPV